MSVFYSWLFDMAGITDEDFLCAGSSEQFYYLLKFCHWVDTVVTDL